MLHGTPGVPDRADGGHGIVRDVMPMSITLDGIEDGRQSTQLELLAQRPTAQRHKVKTTPNTSPTKPSTTLRNTL